MALTVDVTRLLEDLKMDAPGALPSGYQAALFVAVDDFLDFTNVWYEDLPFNLAIGIKSYTLTPPTQGRIVRLMVLYDPNASTAPDLLWYDRAQLILPNQLLVATSPSKIEARVARVSKKVAVVNSDNIPDVPDWIFQRYRDQLRIGALAYLYAQTGRPWGDPVQAEYRGRQFLAFKTTARIDGLKSNVLGQTNWSYPQSFRTSSQRGA